MKIGYARVSTKDQNLNLQIDALNSFGCDKIYSEKVSAAKTDRAELQALKTNLREGDIVVVWKLDRLARSLKELIEIINSFNEQQIGFVSLNDPIDTTTAQGRLVFNIFASLSEFEREIISERTKAGLASARIRGNVGGRPTGISKEAEIKASAAVQMYHNNTPVNSIAKTLNISKATLYKYLRLKGVK